MLRRLAGTRRPRDSLARAQSDDADAVGWPVQYHAAMASGVELAFAHDDATVESVLNVCHTAVGAAAVRAGKEKEHRQGLEDR